MVSLLISLFFGVITLPNRTQSSFHTRIVLCLSTYGPITCIFGSVRGFSPRGTTSTGPCRILHCTNEAGRLIAEAAMGKYFFIESGTVYAYAYNRIHCEPIPGSYCHPGQGWRENNYRGCRNCSVKDEGFSLTRMKKEVIMSISAIDSNSSYFQDYLVNRQNSSQQNVQQDFAELSQALKSGDLSGAQTAYSALQSSTQSTTSSGAANSSTGSNSPTANFNALGQALQSGDLSEAQADLARITHGARSMGGHHRHRVSADEEDTATSSSSNTSSASNPFATDLASLGQALQAGNLASAQTDFSQLQQDLQSAQQGTANTQNAATQSTSTLNNTNLNQLLQMWSIMQGSSSSGNFNLMA